MVADPTKREPGPYWACLRDLEWIIVEWTLSPHGNYWRDGVMRWRDSDFVEIDERRIVREKSRG